MLGVKVQVHPAFLWIKDLRSFEMRRLSESGTLLSSSTGESTTSSSGLVRVLADTLMREPVQFCATSTTG